jgi:hypothetical protein
MPSLNFLDLPGEIRYMIYQYLLIDINNTAGPLRRTRHPLLSIVNTCTLCRLEAMALYARTTTFNLSNWKMLHRLAKFEYIKLVKHVSIQFERYPLHPTIICDRISGLEQLDYISDPVYLWQGYRNEKFCHDLVKKWMREVHHARSHRAKTFTGREPYIVHVIARLETKVSFFIVIIRDVNLI